MTPRLSSLWVSLFGGVEYPLVRPLARRGVTPNHVTIAAFVLGLAAAGLVATRYTYAGIALWLASRDALATGIALIYVRSRLD